MNKYKKLLSGGGLSLFFSLLLHVAVFGQRTDYNLYMHDLKLVNPAFVGSEPFHELNLLTNIHAPAKAGNLSDVYLAYETSLEKVNSGVGIWFNSNKSTFFSRTQLNFLYSYKIALGENRVLSLGGNVSYNNTTVDTYYPYASPDDPAYTTASTFSSINSGVGIAYQDSDFKAGLSLVNISSATNIFMDMRTRQLNGFIGYTYALTESLSIQPSASAWLEDFEVYRLDINSILRIKNRVWVGGSYQMGVDKEANWNVQLGGSPVKDWVSLGVIVYSSEYQRFPKSEGINIELLVKARIKN